jgi:hypothetical protein
MQFTDLEPQFVRPGEKDGHLVLEKVQTLQEAKGVMFLCPHCFQANGGPAGTHRVLCWTPEVPLEVGAGPGRWPMAGTGYDDLTLTPSVQLLGACGWHGFVIGGKVTTV